MEDDSDCSGSNSVIEDSNTDNIPSSTARDSCFNHIDNNDGECDNEQFECSQIHPNTVRFEYILRNDAVDFDTHICDMEQMSNSCLTKAASDSPLCISFSSERSTMPCTSLRTNGASETEDSGQSRPGAFHVLGRAPGQLPAWVRARITSPQTQREIWNSSRSIQSNRNSESIEQAITDYPVAVAIDHEDLERNIRLSIIDSATRAVLVSPDNDNCKNSVKKILYENLIYANLVIMMGIAMFWIVDAMRK